MGSSASKPDVEIDSATKETTFFAPRPDQPVQFSDDLISHLSSTSPTATSSSSPSSGPSAARQTTLDGHIQARISSELQRLHAQEVSVRDEIERALEKENLEGEAGGTHSATLLKDLEDLESRTVGLREESKRLRDETKWTQVALDRKKLAACFAADKETPLNCRSTADSFLDSVAAVEKSFVASIH